MFITKKEYAKDLDRIQYNHNYEVRCLKQDNLILSQRVRNLELDLKAIKDFLKINLITIPAVYKAVLKEDESESN